jgi:hypothetical protein
MHTLYDFITHVKGVEYLMAVGSIAVFLLFWEALKPKPFQSVINEAGEDLQYIRERGYGNTLKSIGRIAAAPFIGIAYVVAVPVSFFLVLALGAIELMMKGITGITGMLGKQVTFEWRPMEAYLTGKKKKGKKSGIEKK